MDRSVLASVDRLPSVSTSDVIPAAEVESAIEGIRAELAGLEIDLASLRRQAESLEERVTGARSTTAEDRRALDMVERALAETLRTTRAGLQASLEEAERDAAARVAAARRTASHLLGDTSRAVGSRPPQAPADPPSPVLPRWTPAQRLASAPEHDERSTPVEAHVELPGAVSHPPAPVALDELRDAAPAAPAPGGVSSPDQFVAFWNAETPAPPPKRRLSPNLADALLPLIAVAIVLVVLLSWIG